MDCGATVNVLPIKFITDEVVTPTDRILQMWNKSEVKPLGTTRMTIRNPKNTKKYLVEFLVVNEDLTPLLGAKVTQCMGLIEVHSENFEQIAAATTHVGTPKAKLLIEEFKDVFEGDVGMLEGTQRLEVDPSILPVISPSKHIPFAIKPKLASALDRLVSLDILAPVEEPTDWVSNLVIANKPSGDLQICLDLKQLNLASIPFASHGRCLAFFSQGQSIHKSGCSQWLLAHFVR